MAVSTIERRDSTGALSIAASCRVCEQEASHQVREVPPEGKAPLRTWLCCFHFGLMFGSATKRRCQVTCK